MIELIKHTLGVCGEHSHPNIFTILFIGLVFTSIYKLRNYDKN